MDVHWAKKPHYVHLYPVKPSLASKILYRVLTLKDQRPWYYVQQILNLINYLYVSYMYIFVRNVDKYSYGFILFCDLSFAVDAILSVMVKYYTIRKKRRILKRTLLNNNIYVAFEVLTALPYSYIYEVVESELTFTFLILRGISLLRIFKLLVLFNSNIGDAVRNHVKSFALRFFIFTYLLHHTIACVYYTTGRPLLSTERQDWAKKAVEEDHWQWYIVCLYISGSLTHNVGMLLYQSKKMATILLRAFSMIIGQLLLSGYVLGSLSLSLYYFLEKRGSIRKQMLEIYKYLDLIEMDDKGKKKIKEYYKTLWYKKDGINKPHEHDILPSAVRNTLNYDVNSLLLQQSLIFKNRPEPLLRKISFFMKHEFYPKGHVIYKQNMVKKMIFVLSGFVEILSEEDDETSLITFGPGTCFGEASLVYNVLCKSSIRAGSYVEIETLDATDYFEIKALYPNFLIDVKDIILSRIQDVKDQKNGNEPMSKAINLIKEKIVSTDEFENDTFKYLYLYQPVKPAAARQIFLSTRFPPIISPYSNVVKGWNTLIVILVVVISILYPFYAIFKRYFPSWLYFVGNIVEIFYIMDIYVILTTAIIERKTVVKTFTKILQYNLLDVGFYLDLASCLHLEIISLLMESSNDDRVFYLLKLNRLLKSYRIIRYFQHLESRFIVNIQPVRIIKYFLYISLPVFWSGCLTYLISCFYEECREGGWFQSIEEKNKNLSITGAESILSIYYAISLLTTLGIGDILPKKVDEILMSYCFILLGFLVFGFCTAHLSATISIRLSKKIRYQEFLMEIDCFIKDRKIVNEIKERIVTYFSLQWYYDKAARVTGTLFSNASEQIQNSVMIQERLETMAQIPLFKTKSFLEDLLQKTECFILQPNELIVHTEKYNERLFIIQEGYCHQYTSGSETLLGPACHFGIGSVLSDLPSLTTVKTKTHVKLITITRDVFWETVALHPTEFQKLDQVLSKFVFRKRFVHLTTSTVLYTDESQVNKSITFASHYCSIHNESYIKAFKPVGFLRFFLIPICIHPNGNFLKIWVVFRLITHMVHACAISLQITYAPYWFEIDLIVLVLDVISYLDLYLMMLVGYFGDKNQFIIHPAKTAIHYLTGPFLIDLLVCFPWEILLKLIRWTHNEDHYEYSHTTSPHIMHCYLKIIRILQVFKIGCFVNYLAEDVTRKGIKLQILKFIPIMMATFSIFALIVIKLTCEYLSRKDVEPWIRSDGLAKPPGLTAHYPNNYAMYCSNNSWIANSRHQNVTNAVEVFGLAFFLVSNTMMIYGSNDMTVQNTVTLWLICIAVIISFFFLVYMYAIISSHRLSAQNISHQYKKHILMLNRIMVKEKVDRKFRKSILEQKELVWKRSRGHSPRLLLSLLHPTLHLDVLLFMYEKALKSMEIFDEAPREVLQTLLSNFKEMSILKKGTILRIEDVIEDIFIVYRGEVTVVSKYKETEQMLVGGIFGNISPLVRIKMSVNLFARTNVDLLYMKGSVFYSIISDYSKVKNTFDQYYRKKLDYILPHESALYSNPTSLDMDSVLSISKATDTTYGRASSTFSDVTNESDFIIKKHTLGFSLLILPHKWFRAVILPNSYVFTITDYSSLLVSYMNFLLVLYIFTFQQYSAFTFGIIILFDVYFIIKAFLDLHKAYENRYGNYIVDNRKILKKYFQDKQRRIYDIFTILPIYYIAFFTPQWTHKNFLVFSSLRLVTVLRVIYIYDFYKTKSKQLMVNKVYLKLGIIIMTVSAVTHCLTCIWYLLACPLVFCFQNSWYMRLSNSTKQEPHQIYIWSLYYMVDVMTSTAENSKVRFENYIELIFTIAILIIMKFVTATFIGDCINVLQSSNSNLDNYERSIKELRVYYRNRNTSNYQMSKMWEYLGNLWRKTKGKTIQKLTKSLPYTFKCSVMLEMYGIHLKHCYIFMDAEVSFLRQLCAHMMQAIYFSQDYIVRYGDIDETMYFIHSGEVEILTIHSNFTETLHEILKEGDVFGLTQGLNRGIPHNFTFRAKEDTDILSLVLNDWEYLFNYFPDSKKTIYKKAIEIYNAF